MFVVYYKQSFWVFYSRPTDSLPMFQLVLCKEFKKLQLELIYWMNSIAFVYRWILLLDIYINFLLHDWKKEVNHSLIKTPLKKNSTLRCRILIFFGVNFFLFPMYIIYKMLKKDTPSKWVFLNFWIKQKSCIMLRTTQVTKFGSNWATGLWEMDKC